MGEFVRALIIFMGLSSSVSVFAAPPMSLEKCEEYMAIGALPRSVTMVFTRREMTAFFERSVRNFRENFKREELHELTERLAGGGEMTPHDLSRFAANRGPLRQLRFAFGLFGRGHEYPPILNSAVKLLGDIQDAYRNGRPEILQIKAKALLALVEPNAWEQIETEILKFRPCSTQSFMRYVERQIYYLEIELGSGKLTGDQFHEMRKVIGRLVALYSLLNLDMPADEIQLGVNYLSAINLQMGLLHDDLVAESLALTRDYHRDRFELDARLRDLLTKLIRDFSRI